MDEPAGSGISGTSKQRISHACEFCRAKRVRCTGERPTCSRCEQLDLTCSYGFARGGRRKRFLAALDEKAERSGAAIKGEDGDTDMQDDLPQGEFDLLATPESVTLPSHAQLGLQKSSNTSQDSVSPIKTTRHPSTSSSTSSQRKTRISNACLECKRKRRKCTGGQPCELCVAFKNECTYDPSQDRRSKAYFHQKVIDGVLGAMSSNNPEDIFALLRKNAHFDDVASGIQSALNIAEHSRSSSSAPSTRQLSDSQTPSTRKLSESETPPVHSQGTPSNFSYKCESFCGLSATSPNRISWCPIQLQDQQLALLNGPEHLMTPFNIPHDSPHSRAFITFMQGAKVMVEDGAQLEDVLGPLDPDVDLLFRERRPEDLFTASSWACAFGSVFTHMDFYTQLANIFLLARYMRWILHPTFENYTMLPALMRPTVAQKTIPHCPSADLYSLPEIRDCLIKGQVRLPGPLGEEPVKGLKLSWPYDLDKAITLNPISGALSISRLFGEFASDAKNWSCSSDFLESFPEATSYLDIIEHHHGWDELQPDRKLSG